jgi:P63C domain
MAEEDDSLLRAAAALAWRDDTALPAPETPQSKGGKLRAKSLTPEQRAAIAREAANTRWDGALPKAIAGGPERPLNIAGFPVPCYVLSDDRRMIAMTGVTDTLNIARGGSMKRGVSRLELFVSGKLIKPFISNDLLERVRTPVRFKVGSGTAYGYSSDTLIEIAEAVIRADNAGALQVQQARIAYQCRLITASLTRVGLVALIDEATGYQAKRDSDELQKILEAYVLPEHRPWTTAIPQDFMKELYRVYGWKRSADNRGPRYAGTLIRQLIYEKLPKPVLPELDARNPSNEKHRRKHKHHQFLTDKIGLEHFKTQTVSVMTLLRASPDKKTFRILLERVFGEQLTLDLGDDNQRGDPKAA